MSVGGLDIVLVLGGLTLHWTGNKKSKKNVETRVDFCVLKHKIQCEKTQKR